MEACECTDVGFCKRWQREMTAEMLALCQDTTELGVTMRLKWESMEGAWNKPQPASPIPPCNCGGGQRNLTPRSGKLR